MRLRRVLAYSLILLLSLPAMAGEGLWMVQDPGLDKLARQRGLKFSVKDISNSVVTLGFRYSGSVVSDRGLILTSSAPVITYLEGLGIDGRKHLREGFGALTDDREIPLKGESIYVLRRTFDVTEEVESMTREFKDPKEIATRLEDAYAQATGLYCKLSLEWEGEKAYISAYKVYDDVRLVCLPPQSLARPGKEWSWPAHGCDFALLRIYENGAPVSVMDALFLSQGGYSRGSQTVTMGFPAHTERFLSSSAVNLKESVDVPVSNALLAGRLEILRRGIESDPEVRMKYYSRTSTLEKELGFGRGLDRSCKRLGLISGKETYEMFMPDWFLDDLRETYRKAARVEGDKAWRRETLHNGSYAAGYLREASSAESLEKMKEILTAGALETDSEVEKELIAFSLREYFTNLDNYYFGPYQKWIQDRFGYDYLAAAEYLWNGSLLSSERRIREMASTEDIKEDALWRFLSDSPLSLYDGRWGHKETFEKAGYLSKEYVRYVHRDETGRGVISYSEADSTMRVSFGTVGGYSPRDAEHLGWYTVPDGLVKEYDIPEKYQSLLKRGFWGRWGFRVGGKRHGMIVDFLIDNDFADGCQGSPILDTEGRLIGLVSGGNEEALASGVAYHDDLSKCVGTDIRFILWYLERASGLKRLVKELQFI